MGSECLPFCRSPPLRGRCPAGQRGVKPRIETVRLVLRSDRSRRSLKKLGLPKFFRPSLRHPLALMFQFPRSATVTPAGVLAMRSRRGCEGQDAKPSPPGSRKMVSLWRHGGNGRASDLTLHFISELARQACLCGTHGEWCREGLSGQSAGSPGADRFQQTFPAAISGRETEVAGKNR